MSRPRIMKRCVAQKYAAPNERIAEFGVGSSGVGGFISFYEMDGKLNLSIYGCNGVLRVIVPSGVDVYRDGFKL